MSYGTCDAPDCTKPAKRKWCSESCRRRTEYGGACERCGKRTDGSNGSEKAPKLCRRCAPSKQRRWSKEGIVLAIHRWYRRTGSPPTSTEWQKGELGEHPTTSTVINVFGRWNAGLEAAGFPPHKRGRRPRARPPLPPPPSPPPPPRAISTRRKGGAVIRNFTTPPRAARDEKPTNSPAANRARIAAMRAGVPDRSRRA